MKKITAIIVTLIVSSCMLLSASAQEPAAESQGQEATGESAEGESRGGHGGGSAGSSGGVQNDETIQAALDEAAGKFIQETFTDPETGFELEYSLYIPADYSEEQSYPMIMFIPDMTGAGRSAAEIVSSFYGAAVWATEEEQAKHLSFVFVPAFTETVVDDNWNVSDQVETAVRAIRYLTETYSIDTDRLYTTGQSMGCMTSLYLNSRYPDLFAASMYVSGQWDISVLGNMTDQTFFYITSAGDTKASGGQSEVMAMLEEAGTSYTYGEWNCQAENQSEMVSELIAQGLPANMVRFDAQYTDESGNEQTLGHMQSFNFGYKLEAVRDWLFEQSK